MNAFHPVEEIIADIRAGKMVIFTDDESRENEGDLVFAAESVSSEKVNFMTKFGRGLICAPLTEERLKKLGLRDMVLHDEDHLGTAFTVSVDAAVGITTGISAHDRARTIELLADPRSRASDLKSPGHVFPLRAKNGGVLTRAGHTEAGVDLARLAGLQPAAVICEIMSEDGSMARTPELFEFAVRHGLKIGTIQSLIEYRRKFDKLVEKVSEAILPTSFGEWKAIVYRSLIDQKEHIALVKGKLNRKGVLPACRLPAGKAGTGRQYGPTLVRVHSECFTGEVLGSLRCDCRQQLDAAMALIHEKGEGVILYMRQEGRGIGLANKIKAYQLQDEGLDTVEANVMLGFKPDLRDYGIGAQILSDLGLCEIQLITNNPRKIVGLGGYGLKVVERIPLVVQPTAANEKYLRTKKEKLGHLIDL